MKPRRRISHITRVSAALAFFCCTAVAAAQAPFLWHVGGAHATQYLLGSVHLLPARAKTLPPALQSAYTEVGGVVFETSMAALSRSSIQRHFTAAAQAESTLRSRIPPKLYAATLQRAQQLNMPMRLCQNTRMWWCALQLGLYALHDAGFSPGWGIDEQIHEQATADGKMQRWFETIAAHLGLFTHMGPALSRAMLRAALAPENDALATPKGIYQAWRTNDIATVAGFDRHFKHRHPALYARLIASRNHAWMPKLKTLMNSATSWMIVVGAAHCVGPDGLVTLLRRAGYRVAPGLALHAHPAHARVQCPVISGTPKASCTTASG